ncbi:hypothetical protein ACFODO_20640 [Acinetobacter sichuanensis]|uniref:Uncharacterized protein n=1 Tax=Acinetobacter sichuanensis TaxID=2136183 RepID=A0A371YIY5_9GAMM|nr:hypothetical protein [Acinetobacter sichuanensis]RFC81396.1 hypothetical protein C9E89_022110 [Acinetobacter sichuanensis]
MKVYEVGTFEKYEAGFHAFYRTLSEEKAKRVHELAKEMLSKIGELEFGASDEESKKHYDLCRLIDIEFIERSGIDFCLSSSANDCEIEMHSFDLD